MIHFERMTMLDQFLELLIPSRRRERERKTREYIRFLVMSPDEPCVIAGRLIPNGHGGNDAETGCGNGSTG